MMVMWVLMVNGSNKRFKLVKIFDQVGMTLKLSLSIFFICITLMYM